ncbi:PE family protein [Mycobacterium marinum]|uniref:PE family protein n=1 Tax=Mycobacterium marinum TaxID=1781 RepID=UPI0030B996DD
MIAHLVGWGVSDWEASHVVCDAIPEVLGSAAADSAGVGSALSTANAAAPAQTTPVALLACRPSTSTSPTSPRMPP